MSPIEIARDIIQCADPNDYYPPKQILPLATAFIAQSEELKEALEIIRGSLSGNLYARIDRVREFLARFPNEKEKI